MNRNRWTLGFSSGRSQQVLQSSNLPPFLMLICYEAIFSEFVDRGSDGATWIVQITNDAWFENLMSSTAFCSCQNESY